MPIINFAGLASGLDTEAIIAATLAAKRAQIISPLNKKIEQNTQQNNALNALNQKLLSLYSDLKTQTTAISGGIDKKVTVSDPVAVTATTNSTYTPVMSASFEINQLATTGGIAFTNRYPDIDTPLFPGLSGTSDITLLLGAAQDPITVTVDNTTTLSELNDLIATASSGKIQGSIVNVNTASSPSYAFMINTTVEGTDNGSLAIDIPLDIAATGNLTYNPSDTSLQAKDAILTLPGIGIVTRSSNTINDLFPGITLELKQTTTSPVTLSTAHDVSRAKELVQALVNKVNEIITFSSQYSNITTGKNDDGETTLSFGALSRTRVDEQVVSAIKFAFSSIHSDVPDSSVNILADLGITTKRDGTFEFNFSDFDSAFARDIDASFALVQTFVDSLGSAGSVLDEYSKSTGSILTSINSGNNLNKSLQERIDRLEQTLGDHENSMRMMFARLEVTMARLNSSSQSLSAIISSLTVTSYNNNN